MSSQSVWEDKNESIVCVFAFALAGFSLAENLVRRPVLSCFDGKPFLPAPEERIYVTRFNFVVSGAGSWQFRRRKRGSMFQLPCPAPVFGTHLFYFTACSSFCTLLLQIHLLAQSCFYWNLATTGFCYAMMQNCCKQWLFITKVNTNITNNRFINRLSLKNPSGASFRLQKKGSMLELPCVRRL